MLTKFASVKPLENIALFFLGGLPGELGVRLRFLFWRSRLKYLGKGARIDVGVYFQNPQYISIGEESWVDRNVIILAGIDESQRERQCLTNPNYPGVSGEVYIGKRVHVAPHVIISGISSGVYISDECGIAAGSKIYAFSNHYRSFKSPADSSFHFGPLVEPSRQSLLEGPVFLGPNTGVALSSVILPGVSFGANCFISINSVVMHGARFPDNVVVAGQPAKQVGSRFKLQ